MAIGIKQLEKKYAILQAMDYGSDGANTYTCNTYMGKKQNENAPQHTTLVLHAVKGVTPMFISCPVCGGQSTSAMYRMPSDKRSVRAQAFDVWVRPSFKWLKNKRNDPKLAAVVQHVLDGGLVLKSDL